MYLFEKLVPRENSSKRVDILYLQGKKVRQRQSKDLYRCLVSQNLSVPWLELSIFSNLRQPLRNFLIFSIIQIKILLETFLIVIPVLVTLLCCKTQLHVRNCLQEILMMLKINTQWRTGQIRRKAHAEKNASNYTYLMMNRITRSLNIVAILEKNKDRKQFFCQ